ncbi:MAG: dioxygenase [Colwellia sp.]|nr:dioxygenase [Aureispira sp.]MBL4764539.1 dioxygenase [Colwellia sp.]
MNNTSPKMLAPLMFIGHGAPTLAIDHSTVTRQLNKVGKQFGHIKAILVISAHWLSKSLEITGHNSPEIIYDFYGFQPELYQVNYAAKGNTVLAKDIAAQLNEKAVATKVNMQRGLDHGVWTPLLHLLPGANIPVLQLSIPQLATSQSKDLNFYFNLGKAIATLREQGIAIVGSGNVTHNLRALSFNGKPDQQVIEFELWVRNKIKNNDFNALINAPLQYPNFNFFHPSIEHYIPLLFVLGAVSEQDKLTVIENKIDLGVISMESYLFN